MKRLRVKAAALSPVVVALFALTIAAPRPTLLYHEHAGGTLPHAHGDAEDLAELFEHHGHRHDHDAVHAHGHHHHDDTDAHPTVPASRSDAPSRFGDVRGNDDESATTGHWHEQPRFHRAVIAGPPAIAVSAFSAAAPPSRSGCPVFTPARSRHARAPPHSFPLA